MTLCVFCQAINVATLPSFPGFSKNLWPKDLPHIPSQQHQTSLTALRASATTCEGCAVLFEGLMAGVPKKIEGTLLKHVGTDKFTTDPKDPSMEHAPVELRGLAREGSTEQDRRLYGLLAQCGPAMREFGLFADDNSVAALQGTVVGRKPAPVGHPDRVLEWLRVCEEKHSKCSSFQQILSPILSFPTRVLDLESLGPAKVRLVSGAGLQGRYVALSHCWGKAPIVRTVQATLAQFLRSIDVASLNKTFQDAIMVTRRLGLRYLWIDSLCIIQDDVADWEREAASMAQVYSQAYLTIAASAATDGTQGLLRTTPEGAHFDLYVDPEASLSNAGVSIGPFLQRFRRLVAAPLNTRAWTLQERILSPRMLHYAQHQLHWECRESIISEAGGPPFGELIDNSSEESWHRGRLGEISDDLLEKDESQKLQDDDLRASNGRREHESWYGLIQEYCERDLTNGSDKLPALSGIAHAYSQRHDAEYVAGLWLDAIATGLLWHCRDAESLQRPATYRAPSWSWASVDGPVEFFSVSDGLILGDAIEIYDISGEVIPDGLDPFGKVRSGKLSLWGAVKTATLKTIYEDVNSDKTEKATARVIFDEISAIGPATLDTPIPDGEVTCLLIATSYGSFGVRFNNNLVLLLTSTENHNEFKRLGMAMFYEARNYNPGRSITRPDQLINSNSEEMSDRKGESLQDWFYDVDLANITLV
ncbi:heterokaryon incompatibility protein-domain-containing protein [Xylariaceae sp. FL1272]|nr:heterokaryon incompatibility protein-domain-containing protein [Xylariaceae sp. FL1272]